MSAATINAAIELDTPTVRRDRWGRYLVLAPGELHGWSVTGKLGTWSTTLTRPGDQPGSRRPPSDEALLRLLDGDDEKPGDDEMLDAIAKRLRETQTKGTK